MKLCLTSLVVLLPLSVACNGAPAPDGPAPARSAAVTQAATPTTTPAAVVSTERSSTVAASAVAGPGTVQAAVAPARPSASVLIVKRLVVTTGIKDREPLATNNALPADGSAIYAFIELANPVGPSENVRVTFERHGAKERVGDVTLPVPSSTSRHRTWAFTRFIRSPGVWDAVLWSENGAELGRTSFEVSAS